MLNILCQACEKLVSEYDEFWLYAILGDWSFEEGSRASNFRKYVRSWSNIGLHPSLEDCLSKGINGNLAAILGANAEVRDVLQSPSRGPDISFVANGHVAPSVIQVKYVFDGTLPKYYLEVADDLRKLRSVSTPIAGRYLVVFFAQLPYFHYPSGRWYGASTYSGARKTHKLGIDAQYAKLCSGIRDPKTWPNVGGPLVHRLDGTSTSLTDDRIRQRYSQVFVPEYEWHFEMKRELRDAAVGVAVWEIR